MTELKRPGRGLANRPLHFIFIADVSGSMGTRGKIQALNTAIREAIPHMQQEALKNPNAEVLIRAVKFSNGAQWHVSQPTPVAAFTWTDLGTDTVTDMGAAMKLVAEQLKMPPMPERALPPVLVLISDGQPTDDFQAGLRTLLDLPWGKKAVRISIAIGDDADDDVLLEFMKPTELKPLTANSPEALAKCMKWVSTQVLKAASSPASRPAGAQNALHVPVPAPPPGLVTPIDPNDVW